MKERNPIAINLHKKSRLLEESLELPEAIKTVQDLLTLLQSRGHRWQRAFTEDAIQFTVNKEFTELFTVLEQGDEIAFVPKA